MTTHKRKKLTRYRGSHTHGGGAKKKRRGAGHRGGRGMAGSGKRADQKKPSISGDLHYFGKFGFIKKNAVKVNAINLSYFEQKINKLVMEQKAVEKGGVFEVDLASLGYDKLLGSGNLTKKIRFTCAMATESAIAKVKKAGGSVTLTEEKGASQKASESGAGSADA